MSHYSWRAGEYYADCLRSRGVCPQVFLKGCEISKAKPDSVDSNFAVELEKRVSEMYDQCVIGRLNDEN